MPLTSDQRCTGLRSRKPGEHSAPSGTGSHIKVIGHLLAPSPPHLPTGDFLSNEFFLSSKVSWNFMAKFNFLFISVLLLYCFGRILKGFYPIHLAEFDKYSFCSKVHRKQHRTNLPGPCWDQQIHTSTFLFHCWIPPLWYSPTGQSPPLLCLAVACPAAPRCSIPPLGLHCPKYQSQGVSVCRISHISTEDLMKRKPVLAPKSC